MHVAHWYCRGAAMFTIFVIACGTTFICWFTAKTQYRKFEINIPRKGIARPQSQFPTLQRKSHLYIPRKGIVRPQSQISHSCICERFYIYPGSVCLSCCRKICGPILRKYIKSLTDTHECGNWDWGRAIPVPFLGIHKWVLRCSMSTLIKRKLNFLYI